MTTNEELPSIVEYQEDIANAEPPKPLPKGKYRAVIKAATRELSKKESKDMAHVVFVVDSTQYPADFVDGEPDGTRVDYYVMLGNTPRNKYNLRRFCEAIGAPMGRQIDLNTWLDREAMIAIDHREWDGVDQASIARGGVGPA